MATFFNQATLSYNNTVTSSNIVTGERVEALSVTKTAIGDRYRPGDSLAYAISIVNVGTTAYRNLTVTDDLGAYPFGEGQVVPLNYIEDSLRVFVNGVLVETPTVTEDPPLAVSGLSVPPGGNLLLVYRVAVNAFAPPEVGSEIVNTATVSGDAPALFLTAEESVSAIEAPLLAIQKALNPTSVVGNGPITYTFTIQNSGNTAATAEDNVSVTDRFDPILTIRSVTYNGAVLTEGVDYTYEEDSGLFTTVPGRLTVEAATYAVDEDGRITVTPGLGVLVVTGTV